jgi:hypothetical protein
VSLTGAGGAIGGGGTGTHDTVPLLGGLFGGRDDRISGALAGLGDDAEPISGWQPNAGQDHRSRNETMWTLP